MRAAAGLALVFVLAGCGTHSVLRPADTLPEKRLDASGGIAASDFGEVNAVLQLHYGVTSRVEIGGHMEGESWLIGSRFGVFSTERDGMALAVGFQLGQIRRFRDHVFSVLGGSSQDTRFALVPAITLGRRWTVFEPYFGVKWFIFPGYSQVLAENHLIVGKLGTRIHFSSQFYGFVELGVAGHGFVGGFWPSAEGAVGGGASFN